MKLRCCDWLPGHCHAIAKLFSVVLACFCIVARASWVVHMALLEYSGWFPRVHLNISESPAPQRTNNTVRSFVVHNLLGYVMRDHMGDNSPAVLVLNR